MLGLLVLAASLVLAVVAVDRLPQLVLLIASLWVLLPALASDPYALGRIDLHPAAVLTLMVFAVQWSRRPARMIATIERQPAMGVLLFALAVLAPLTAYLVTSATPPMVFGLEQVSCAVMLYTLVGAMLLERPQTMAWLRHWFLVAAVFESLLAVVQMALGATVFYQKYYAHQYWYTPNFKRWMGTTDHPLVLSLLLCVALPLAASTRRTSARILVIMVIMAGLLATESRTGMIVGALEVLYLGTRSVGSWAGRAIVLALVVGMGFYAASSSLVTAAISRFTTDDGGSASVRTQTLQWFAQHVGDTWWLGDGFGQSFKVAAGAGFGTSFENSFVMYSIDMGLVLTLLYFGLLLAAVITGLRRGSVRGPAMAALAAVVVPQTFSALSVRSTCAAIIWMVCAMCVFQRRSNPGRVARPAAATRPVAGRRSTRPAIRLPLEEHV